MKTTTARMMILIIIIIIIIMRITKKVMTTVTRDSPIVPFGGWRRPGVAGQTIRVSRSEVKRSRRPNEWRPLASQLSSDKEVTLLRGIRQWLTVNDTILLPTVPFLSPQPLGPPLDPTDRRSRDIEVRKGGSNPVHDRFFSRGDVT